MSFQDDPSVLDIAISNLPNHLEVSLDNSNRPSSLSGLEEADSGLDDLDTFPSSSSHHSWTYFDTETVKRKVLRVYVCMSVCAFIIWFDFTIMQLKLSSLRIM